MLRYGIKSLPKILQILAQAAIRYGICGSSLSLIDAFLNKIK